MAILTELPQTDRPSGEDIVTFEDALDQATHMLRRRGRVTYRTLQQQFSLDDTGWEDLKAELLYTHPEVIDDPTLQASLAQLVDTEILHCRGQPPNATYLFRHALVQDAAYQSLLRRTRQQIHQQVTELMEERFPEIIETQPELIASHAARGDMWDTAYAYFRQAGSRAMARCAYREAPACFEQAQAALHHLPQNRDTQEKTIDLLFMANSQPQPRSTERWK